jgi:uncharacterized protein
MIIYRHLLTLIVVMMTVFPTASCQTKQSGGKEVPAKPVRTSQQVFWDSLPQPTGYVNDYENLFTDAEEQSLDSLMGDFEKRTTIQIAVVTFDTTMTTRDSLDALTLRIGEVWGVGRKHKNNGIVIGISRGYRQMRIQNGYGIERFLSDEQTKQIIDNAFIPAYRAGKYFEGTLAGLKALMKTLLRD